MSIKNDFLAERVFDINENDRKKYFCEYLLATGY